MKTTFTGKGSIGIYEGLTILGIIIVIAVCAVKRSYFFSGTVLGASLVGYLLAFFLASFGLRRQGLGWERIFYAVASAAAARWLFEIIYHYVFPASPEEFVKDLQNLSTNISETNFPLLWSVMMVMIIFTGYKYMAAGRWFWFAAGATTMFFLFWILVGYPQWVRPEQWPIRHPFIPLISPTYAHAPDTAAMAAISRVSLAMNSATKIAACAVLPLLFFRADKT